MDNILNSKLEKEMKDAYIHYAMSVIVSRALPDARDGLKPVHRRILHSMNELNIGPDKPYKKSARIVGDTMGKYHPHGESSIYDALVRMAQDFSMRYMLVDGHGNFGSIDGYEAAAQRYTEARLSRLSMEMLSDIEKETVDFIPNYDGEFQEPTVLPSRFPNLLVNGSSGIAVGMATNIPPHNLTDCISAIVKLIDDASENVDTDVRELINIVKAPDYPTGGAILGVSGVHEAYLTGRGRVVLRATAAIEPFGQNRERILVSEIPYQVNKAKLVEKMAELVKDKKIDGITDIRDESNRNGVRIVIELRRDANANVILNQLYKFSQLQESFGIILLALVKNEPRVLNLKQILQQYVEHQKDVITRRTRFELNKAQKRAHILEGYLKALDIIDEVIHTIRTSRDTPTARERLRENFDFTDEQASAIVDMRLRALTGLEKERLQAEFNELQVLIKELTSILSDANHLLRVLKDELLVIKEKFGDKRRTAILHDPGEINVEDLIDDAGSVITLSQLNYIKRIPLDTYRSQNRGGRGIVGMQTREEDWVKDLFVANTHDHILFFTDHGRVYRIRAFEIPEASRTARGMAIVNLLNLSGGETVAAVVPMRGDLSAAEMALSDEDGEEKEDESDGEAAGGETYGDGREYLTMITRAGIIKRTEISLFANIKKAGLIALNIREDDALIAVLKTDGRREIFLATANGMGIRFPEGEVRPMGRTASGVKAMRLKDGDRIVGASAAEGLALFVAENGFGKCTLMDEFRGQHRGGMGMTVYKTSEKTGKLTGVSAVSENDELMLINSEGVIIRIRVSDISVQGRYAQGVKLIQMNEGVTVAGMARVVDGALMESGEGIEETVETEAE
ncbi:MAG: DNA gyrase subunit A [Clostridiales bacterium]|jgi:DNA gyrase subunit A|nr:DNA gyrase subunit A [Clostridiales bacterium]